MTYTVKYRDTSGALKSEVVEASKKADALSAIHAKGFQPISVTEGGKINAGTTRPAPRIVYGIVAGLIVLLGGIGALVLVSQGDKATHQKFPVEKKVKAKPQPKPSVVKAPTTHKTEVSNRVEQTVAIQPKRLEGGVEVVSSSVRTNNSGAIIERLVLADGTTKSKIHPPEPVFKHASDQVIAMCLTTKPGQSMPPLPMLDKSLEKDFVEAMLEPIVISDGDSPEVKDLKARVMETRAYLKDEIKNGKTTLLEALREHQQSMEKTADAHTMALQEYQKMKQEGPQDEADAFLKAVNESFKARGIPEISLNENEFGESRRRK